MIAVIYRSYVEPEKENHYMQLWKTIANYFVEYRGAIGSSLHKTQEGYWLVYSRWTDQETRDKSWPSDDEPSQMLPENIRHAITEIKKCVDQSRKFPEICMEIKDDLLVGV
ncbi:antibiotic biosynthesis monooxygenase family protein [Dongshaea marina]|uniref:antibiotic biosynthesis monooxygenase family protein n=1 Tax=Dongshaea marina TaxID=2047966 RepID=UPI000D3E84B6|nr:antibiotic biosynthesis monooxygenase [Dongshaea marina]